MLVMGFEKPSSMNSLSSILVHCNQFLSLLEAAGSFDPGAPKPRNRDMRLVCRRVISRGWSMVDFSIAHPGSSREWLLFPTRALSAFRFNDGKLSLLDTDTTYHRSSLDEGHKAQAPDFNVMKGWIASCRSNHSASCGKKPQSGVGPVRLIDCEGRQLCLDVDKPYVCLSYVWGAHEATHGISGGLLLEPLPQTVSDAMAVTLKIGFRYLWVDRYCIDQNDAEAKHSAILNMDRICKSTPAFAAHSP